MQIHNVQREHPNLTKKRVGRGGKRGKTAGRGMKGQKARAGTGIRPDMRDHIKKLPKQRGYRFSSHKTKPEVVNVAFLDQHFESGTRVTPRVLVDAGLVRFSDGKVPQVKVLGDGEISKKLEVARCTVSAKAKEKIENAGGTVA